MQPSFKACCYKSRANNMPNSNIEKAIKKGSGESDGEKYEEYMYESYAPEGVALLIETLTENKNRTIPEIKNILAKNNATLATSNSVSRLFERLCLH